ncbi:serine protease 53-like [Poeciliopsis prolifica]|uniref:serine protease 53-like n=1 Tax=Poeciliopsis prolifica TaxID=188132 RepID=UPI002413C322|nr:serine protease 53-like [Poeciliopsis prolifica]
MFILKKFQHLLVLTFLCQTVHASHIINGDKAPVNSMQYMVSVQSNGRHACGGFLISEDFVLTAAHCNIPKPNLVVVGNQNIRSSNIRKINIQYSCVFPDYQNVGSGDDIMLLKLSEKVSNVNAVKTIPIPNFRNFTENQRCMVAGWGKTESNIYSNDLRVAEVKIINSQVCQKAWDNTLPPNVICAGGFGTTKGFCQGDSGGPLVCDGKAVGIVSFNRNSNCSYPNAPNIYTDISMYHSWLRCPLKDKKCCCATQVGSAGIMDCLSTFLFFNVLACLGQTVQGSDIIHGEKAPANSMQYMVSVQNKQGHTCGGFLVRQDIVVTAAHCADDAPVHVVLGTHKLSKRNMSPVNIEYFCRFPNYTAVGRGDDIMLLKLSRKFPLNNRVKIIPLPSSSNANLKDDQNCSVAGWGKTETNHVMVDDLRVVNVSILNPQLCREKWGAGFPPNVICAGGYNTDKGFCQGDSGGPLVCNGVAVGVVSFNKLNNCNYPDVPNVYTDISKYLQWINNIVKTNKCVS